MACGNEALNVTDINELKKVWPQSFSWNVNKVDNRGKVGHQHAPVFTTTQVRNQSVCLYKYLKLLQSTRDERLTRCLLPAESEHVLHALLKGLSLGHQMSRLHHYQENVLHLKAHRTSGRLVNERERERETDRRLNVTNLHVS